MLCVALVLSRSLARLLCCALLSPNNTIDKHLTLPPLLAWHISFLYQPATIRESHVDFGARLVGRRVASSPIMVRMYVPLLEAMHLLPPPLPLLVRAALPPLTLWSNCVAAAGWRKQRLPNTVQAAPMCLRHDHPGSCSAC